MARGTDYSAELNRLGAHGWIICGPAALASRTLRFKSAHLARRMGDVWNALDAWVDAGRPHAPAWLPLDPDTAEGRVSHALVRYYVADAWHELTGGDL